jgi:hypothetical protein
VWNSLIDLGEAEPVHQAIDPGSSNQTPRKWSTTLVNLTRRVPGVWWTIAGVFLLCSIIAMAAGVLKVRTPEGVIVVEGMPSDAVVEIDGTRIKMIPREGESIRIQKPPGKYYVQVLRGGDRLEGKSITLESGKESKLVVRLDDPYTVQGRNNRAGTQESGSEGLEVGTIDANSHTPTRGGNSDGIRSSIDQGSIDPTLEKAQKVSGSWRIEGDELVQSDDSRIAEIAFGDTNWSEYDLSLEIKKEKESLDPRSHGIWVLFHRPSLATFCSFGLGVFHNKGSQLYFEHQGQKLGRKGENSQDNWAWRKADEGRWYTVRVRVRKTRFECYLDDDLLFEESHPLFTHGRIGLRTWSLRARFRRIKVTDPTGRVLFEGLPKLEAFDPTGPRKASGNR